MGTGFTVMSISGSPENIFQRRTPEGQDLQDGLRCLKDEGKTTARKTGHNYLFAIALCPNRHHFFVLVQPTHELRLDSHMRQLSR